MKSKEQDIIEAAVRLFSEKGYTATSVDEIARESGMAKASFYKFFQSKEDVLIATVLEHGRMINERIERLYAGMEQSPEQKLNGFVQLHLSMMLESKIHSILMALHDKTILQNEKLLQACLQVEYQANRWCTDCLTDIYGEQVSIYVYDIIFMVRSLLMQYLFLPVIGLQPQTTNEELARFLAGLVDQMVKNMVKYKYKPIWDWKKVTMKPECVEQSPVFQGIMIHELLLAIKRHVDALAIGDEEKQELWQVLHSLEQEVIRTERRSGMIRALLNFISGYDELTEYARKLQQIVDLRQSSSHVTD